MVYTRLNVRTFKLFCNPSEKSRDVKIQLQTSLARAGFVPAGNSEVPQYSIAVGGDGCFLRMVRESQFNPETKYIGVNTGTLGFLQEIKADEIDKFVQDLKSGNYIEQNISYLEYKIADEEKHALNEIVIRDEQLHILKLEISVDGQSLQNFVGDGILVCTSVGSTAYNLALGGSFVPFEIDTMQLTPIAPVNSIAYRSFMNPVIMQGSSVIEVTPEKPGTNVIVCTDGEHRVVKAPEKITIALAKSRIKYIKVGKRSFCEKINEKFVGNYEHHPA